MIEFGKRKQGARDSETTMFVKKKCGCVRQSRERGGDKSDVRFSLILIPRDDHSVADCCSRAVSYRDWVLLRLILDAPIPFGCDWSGMGAGSQVPLFAHHVQILIKYGDGCKHGRCCLVGCLEGSCLASRRIRYIKGACRDPGYTLQLCWRNRTSFPELQYIFDKPTKRKNKLKDTY